MMKHLIGTVMAAVFAIASLSAIAEGTPQKAAPLSNAVQMTDAELDQVTAAGAFTVHFILNSGNAGGDPRMKGNPLTGGYITCVNCAGSGLESGPAQGFHLITNRGHPTGKAQCFGGFTFGFPGAPC